MLRQIILLVFAVPHSAVGKLCKRSARRSHHVVFGWSASGWRDGDKSDEITACCAGEITVWNNFTKFRLLCATQRWSMYANGSMHHIAIFLLHSNAREQFFFFRSLWKFCANDACVLHKKTGQNINFWNQFAYEERAYEDSGNCKCYCTGEILIFACETA